MTRATSLLPAVALALIALIPTGKFFFGKTPAPVDQIHQLPPWNKPQPPYPWDILSLDGALQFLPWRDLVLNAFRQGEVPLWNPYSLNGYPLLANSQSAPLYPLHPISAYLGLDAETLLSLSAWLHLWLAGLGVFFLALRLKATEWGGLIAGSAFTLSAFMVGWLQLPSVIITATWIPWCLLGVLSFAERPSGSRGLFLALPCALLLLGGHLQIALYGLLTVFVALLFVFVLRSPRVASLAFLAMGLGVLCASPQWLPALESAQEGHRMGGPSEEGFQIYQRQAPGVRHLFLLVAPTIFGMPHTNSPWVPQGLTGYWLAYAEVGRHYAELPFYAGPAILPLALFGLFRARRNPWAVLFGILALFSCLLFLNTPLLRLFYFFVPGWSALGSPGRAGVLLTLSLCVLAGCALSKNQEEKNPHATFIQGLVALLWVFGCLLIAFMLAYPNPQMPSNPPTHEMAREAVANARPFLLLSAITCVLLAGAWFPNRFRPWAPLSLLAVNIGALGVLHGSMNPGSPKGMYKESFPGLEVLQSLPPSPLAVINADWSLYFPTPNLIAPPNSLLPYRIREVGGYDSLIPGVRKQKLDEINGQDSAPLANGNMMLVKPTCDFTALRNWGVEYVLTASTEGFPDSASILYQGKGWFLVRLPEEGPPQPRLKQSTFTTLLYEIPEGVTTLKTPEQDIPGWYYLHGNRWLPFTPDRQNPLQGERGELRLRYRPRGYLIGVLLGMLALCAVFAWGFSSEPQRRKDDEAR